MGRPIKREVFLYALRPARVWRSAIVPLPYLPSRSRGHGLRERLSSAYSLAASFRWPAASRTYCRASNRPEGVSIARLSLSSLPKQSRRRNPSPVSAAARCWRERRRPLLNLHQRLFETSAIFGTPRSFYAAKILSGGSARRTSPEPALPDSRSHSAPAESYDRSSDRARCPRPGRNKNGFDHPDRRSAKSPRRPCPRPNKS